MNINLRILWFEDNRSWFDTISKKLTEYARSKNFSLTITRHETVDGQVLSRLRMCLKFWEQLNTPYNLRKRIT